jgi:glycosyltransferase involved in cell wall biosynthesis
MYRTSDLQIMFLSKALHKSAFSSVSTLEQKRAGGEKAKSIQFFTTCPEAWGGSEELWSGAARRLVDEDFQVTANLSYLEETHPRVLGLIESGVRVEKYRGVPLFWRFHGFGGRWEPALTIAHLRATKPRLAVISQGENLDGQRQILYCRAASIPYVVICQKAMEDECPLDENRDDLRESFAHAERIFFVSQHNRAVTEERLGQKLANAEVVWNPFNVDYHPDLEWPSMADGRFRLACVARLWMRDKGQDVLLKVLAQEKWKKRAIDVRFYGNGHNAQGLAEMARMLGTEHVQFCGFADDVTEVWRQCHALILPSRHEGLPLALVEAMLCERPAIATDAGGNAEVLEDEVTGFLAPSATVGGVDDAMERAWNRRTEWQKIGMNAARLIRKKVPEDPCAIFADRLKEIYCDVVRSR